MARRDSVTAQKTRSRLSASSLGLRVTCKRGKRAQNIKDGQKQTPLRRSTRLNRSKEVTEQAEASRQPLASPVSDIKRAQSAQPPPTLLPSKPSKPPKRKRETEQQLKPPSPKRARTSPDVDSITYWTETAHWPRGYFEMSHILARKKSSASLRRKRLDSESGPSSTTPTDQKAREEKSSPYKDARYEALLAAKGSFMDASDLGVHEKSRTLIRGLLEKAQPVPKDSLFREDLFNSTFRKIRNRNETRVIRDISQLLVPSAETFATYGATALDCLIESTNEGWNNSIPVTKTRPQPDYSVGFRREAFTETQLQKLQPFVGELTDTSFFMGTWYMYFPFFSSEVKCGTGALDVADRQNAHSMTLAVRGVVELFRLVKREQELHREILAFSISHDYGSVRIYGHYPIIEGKKTTFYRHRIRTFDFTEEDSKEKWTAYKFTKSVYDTWTPTHFQRLCAAIDAIPSDIHFDVSDSSELQFPSSSGLSQRLESQAMDDEGMSLLDSLVVTPETSAPISEQATFKKPKKR